MDYTRKSLDAIRYGQKLPRKIKKGLLGYRMSSCKLNRLLKSVEVIETFPTMFERPNIYPHTFCPSCGETSYIGTGNMTEYPEHWEYFHCIRCYTKVACIDNSPFVHVLEYVVNGVVQYRYWQI